MKIPFDEENTIRNILSEEAVDTSFINKVFRSASTLYKNADLARRYKKKLDTGRVEMTFTTRLNNLFFIGFCGITLIVSCSLLFSQGIAEQKIFISIFLFVFVFVSLFELQTKKRNLKITLSKSKLIIGDQEYSWQEIYEIYHLVRPYDKGYKIFMILALDTGVTDKFEISHVSYSHENSKLPAYIEFYRKQS